jgi:hypothetical protein
MMWKLRGFRCLQHFFTLFHLFFTRFSGVSGVVFAGCGKRACFFISKHAEQQSNQETKGKREA